MFFDFFCGCFSFRLRLRSVDGRPPRRAASRPPEIRRAADRRRRRRRRPPRGRAAATTPSPLAASASAACTIRFSTTCPSWSVPSSLASYRTCPGARASQTCIAVNGLRSARGGDAVPGADASQQRDRRRRERTDARVRHGGGGRPAARQAGEGRGPPRSRTGASKARGEARSRHAIAVPTTPPPTTHTSTTSSPDTSDDANPRASAEIGDASRARHRASPRSRAPRVARGAWRHRHARGERSDCTRAPGDVKTQRRNRDVLRRRTPDAVFLRLPNFRFDDTVLEASSRRIAPLYFAGVTTVASPCLSGTAHTLVLYCPALGPSASVELVRVL